VTETLTRGVPRPLTISGHPIYPALLPIPILCFTGALITDAIYSQTAEMMWIDFSAWLLVAGLIGGGIAGVVVAYKLVRGGARPSRALAAHLSLLLAAWIVEIFNSLIHSRDGWTAVVPTGIILSLVAAALSLVAGWLWQSAGLGRIGGSR
jgi:uncharacterized membrane protein